MNDYLAAFACRRTPFDTPLRDFVIFRCDEKVADKLGDDGSRVQS